MIHLITHFDLFMASLKGFPPVRFKQIIMGYLCHGLNKIVKAKKKIGHKLFLVI